MPEGDTVYAAGKRLGAALTGQRLIRGELRHPRLVEQDLAGLTVTGVRSVGKHLFTRFDNERSLHTLSGWTVPGTSTGPGNAGGGRATKLARC